MFLIICLKGFIFTSHDRELSSSAWKSGVFSDWTMCISVWKWPRLTYFSHRMNRWVNMGQNDEYVEETTTFSIGLWKTVNDGIIIFRFSLQRRTPRRGVIFKIFYMYIPQLGRQFYYSILLSFPLHRCHQFFFITFINCLSGIFERGMQV